MADDAIYQRNIAKRNLAQKQLQQAFSGHNIGLASNITPEQVDAYVESTLGGYERAPSGPAPAAAMPATSGGSSFDALLAAVMANSQRQQGQQLSQNMNSDFQQQMANANAANDYRYYQALFGRDDARSRILADLENWGGSQRDDANQRYDELQSDAMRDLTARGLRNSSGSVAVRNRVAEERGKALNRINDDIIGRRTQADASLSENVFGTIERRNDVPPNLSNLIALQNGMGMAGYGGGFGSAGVPVVNQKQQIANPQASDFYRGRLPGNSGGVPGFSPAVAGSVGMGNTSNPGSIIPNPAGRPMLRPLQGSSGGGWGSQQGQIARPGPGVLPPGWTDALYQQAVAGFGSAAGIGATPGAFLRSDPTGMTGLFRQAMFLNTMMPQTAAPVAATQAAPARTNYTRPRLSTFLPPIQVGGVANPNMQIQALGAGLINSQPRFARAY